MSAADALQAARVVGVEVVLDRDDLLLWASAPPPPTVIEALSRHKADILALLRPMNDGWSAEDWQAFYDERAGIFEFDGRMARPAAEAQAFKACVVEWLNRNPAPSPAGRCAWCGGCETDSAAVIPFGIEPGTHSWLHSECWRPWQEARRAQAVEALRLVFRPPDAAQSERT